MNIPSFLYVLFPGHISLQLGMKSQSPKEKLDQDKQDSPEDPHRYVWIIQQYWSVTCIRNFTRILL